MANAGGKHFKPKDAPAAGAVPPATGVVPPVRRAQHGDGSARSGKPASGGRHGRPGKSERPGKRRGNVLSNVLIVVGVVLLLVAGGLFIKAQIGYKQAAEYYGGISDKVIKDAEGEDEVPRVDFDALKQVSEDVVGWIYVPGTKINYMVVQGETNDTYLRHLPNGEYSVGGTIFMDMDDTAPGMVDQQTTMYGHHMNDGSMFEAIDQSLDQEVFDTIKKVYYITPETTYVLKPLFTMLVEDDYVEARQANFDSEKAFTQYLQASLAQAKASCKDAAAEIEDADQVLTLVTCAGEIIPRTTRAGMVCKVAETIPAE